MSPTARLLEVASALFGGEECEAEEVQYITENMEVDVLFFQERPVSMTVPNHVALKITESEPGVKGDLEETNRVCDCNLYLGVVFKKGK